MAFGQDMKRCSPPSWRDEFVAGPEEQVVGVAEDDRRREFILEIALGQPFDGGLGADGMKTGVSMSPWAV